MENIIVTDIDNDHFISSDDFTEIYSILEANDEQFNCLWKKIDGLEHTLTSIQSELLNTSQYCLFNQSDSKELKETYKRLLKEQDDNLKIEFTNMYKQIKDNEEVTTYIIMILTCILLSVTIQHYNLSEYSNIFNLNNTEF
tara:strand:+ start:1797 stop:2219 length:423 start_codon:yes stop_codon:yes gene_type:complete